jgi:hypothetical protein
MSAAKVIVPADRADDFQRNLAGALDGLMGAVMVLERTYGSPSPEAAELLDLFHAVARYKNHAVELERPAVAG